MNNDELKAEADLLMQRAGLSELLSAYSRWFLGGSYSYDLMCWRDLDVYVLDPAHDLKRCFDVGYEATQRLAARKAGCAASRSLSGTSRQLAVPRQRRLRLMTRKTKPQRREVSAAFYV